MDETKEDSTEAVHPVDDEKQRKCTDGRSTRMIRIGSELTNAPVHCFGCSFIWNMLAAQVGLSLPRIMTMHTRLQVVFGQWHSESSTRPNCRARRTLSAGLASNGLVAVVVLWPRLNKMPAILQRAASSWHTWTKDARSVTITKMAAAIQSRVFG